MSDFRVVLDGLTHKEANELVDRLKSVEGVESVGVRFRTRDHAFNPESIRIMASAEKVEIAIHLVKAGTKMIGGGIGLAAGNHLYKKIGEGLVDKLWAYMEERFQGTSGVEVDSVLYGPDNKPLKKIGGKR